MALVTILVSDENIAEGIVSASIESDPVLRDGDTVTPAQAIAVEGFKLMLALSASQPEWVNANDRRGSEPIAMPGMHGKL